MSARALVALTVIALGSVPGAARAGVTTHLVPHCSWDNPGHRPYMGDVPRAVDTYAHIPPEVRARLKERMRRHAFDDHVTITRTGLAGQRGEYTDLRMMHFGAAPTLCGTVSRAKWATAHRERALVYCDGPYCVAVPSVCRNVSLITLPLPRADPPGPVVLVPNPPVPTPWTDPAAPNQPDTPTMHDLPKTSVPLLDQAHPYGGAPGQPPATGLPQYLGPVVVASALPPVVAPMPAIPEPSTWAMLVAGIGIVVAVAKYRRAPAKVPVPVSYKVGPCTLASARRATPSWDVLTTEGVYKRGPTQLAPPRGRVR